jgi:hypothetical protein
VFGLEPNLAVSIYVRSSIKFLHFVPFHQQILPPRTILVSDWLLFKNISSETTWQNGAKLGREHLCMILYKASKFQREIIITLKTAAILRGTHPGTIYARFGPYIDAYCQVWLHLAELFQRRFF